MKHYCLSNLTQWYYKPNFSISICMLVLQTTRHPRDKHHVTPQTGRVTMVHQQYIKE
jgi:hypothetical protein